MEPNTSETLADVATNVPTADGGENGTKVVELHELLSKELGREFKDDNAALKAVKDTFNFVGTVGQVRPFIEQAREKGIPISKLFDAMDNELNGKPVEAQAAVDTTKFVTKEEMETERFFTKNSEYEANRLLIEAVAKQKGIPLSDVVTLPEIKTLFDKAKLGDEAEKSKSVVMQSNPRLGMVADKFTQAKELAQAGNITQGARMVTDAVIEAYNLDK